MKTNSNKSSWSHSAVLGDIKQPLDESRMPFGTQISPKNVSETYGRADLFIKNGEWQAWNHTDEVQPDGYLSEARTTFYAQDLSNANPEVESNFDRLWILQMNRGHTWDDDSNRKSLVRTEAVIRHCDAILQMCETPAWAKKIALSRVYSECLNGFNKHYAGADGACIAFALLEMCDDPQEAKETSVAKRASTHLSIECFDREFVCRLINYAFRKYGEEK